MAEGRPSIGSAASSTTTTSDFVAENQSSHGFSAGVPLYFNSTTDVQTLAIANGTGATYDKLVADVIDTDNYNYVFKDNDIDIVYPQVMQTGESVSVTDIGCFLYLSQTEPGKLTKTEPTQGEHQTVGQVIDLDRFRFMTQQAHQLTSSVRLLKSETFTSFTGTSITLANTYANNAVVQIYKNGQLLKVTDDYTVTGQAVTLTTPAIVTDVYTIFGDVFDDTQGQFVLAREDFAAATGGETSLTLTNEFDQDLSRVYINGQLQREGSSNDFVIAHDTITFISALSASDKVTILQMNTGTQSGTQTRENYTHTGGETTLTLSQTPTDTIRVWKNGLLLRVGGAEDYTVSGTTVTLIVASIASDKYIVEYAY